MIGSTLRLTLILVLLIYFLIIIRLLKNKALSLKYTLVWIFSGAVMLLLVIFPQILLFVFQHIGITGYMNGFFLMCIGFLIIILMSLTSIVSRQNRKIRTLIQDNALLEKRIRDLEVKIEKI